MTNGCHKNPMPTATSRKPDTEKPFAKGQKKVEKPTNPPAAAKK